jgi:hypothetical protein
MKSYDESNEDLITTIQLLEDMTKSKKMMYFDIGFITIPLILLL